MIHHLLRLSIQVGFVLAVTCTSYVNADILVFSAKDSHRVEQDFKDLPARFGGFIPPEGIKGLIVYAEPSTACQVIKGPPNNPDYDGYDWIVLIARLNCSFEQKIRNAQKAGYTSAIVHNVNSNDLEPMSAKYSTNITIPSVFVVRCIKDRRRARRYRLPNSSLKKIPTHKYTKGDPYETCAICLEDYVENEKLRILPCAHAYHTKCIDPWLTKNRRVCPVCKRKVFASDERVETDSDSDSDGIDDSTPLIRDASRRPTTQGGTFEPQSDNPFRYQLHNRNLQEQRRDSQNSGDSSSYFTEPPSVGVSSDGDDQITGDKQAVEHIQIEVETSTNVVMSKQVASNKTTFVASKSRSLNGGTPDFDTSVDTTRPYTVSLSVEVDNDMVAITYPMRTSAVIGTVTHPPTSDIPTTSKDNVNIV
ncbi:E3 ubiquitin-protein ligase RNF13-like isoform X3 [Copidosoma floridanum]|uniref:E3 ubiquitin-protein ligase RNF13-like isoform X3 n=1 Tax=Copidosoma floridanum TaxID=29053 RepID=UPI0006C978B2|nr:E3 ubiquitin-protein ligase RNF13-like isoform X3 [Copidosoma floridanum]